MKSPKNKDGQKTGALLPAEKALPPAIRNNETIDETVLFERVAAIIENRKSRAAAYANSEVTLMFWEVGQYVNSIILDFKRATYGKKILSELATKLVERYGKSFSERNLYRMTQFFECFSDFQILTPLASKLSWTHLPPKAEFERKIREILTEARERLDRHKSLADDGIPRHIDYFIEPKDDEDEQI